MYLQDIYVYPIKSLGGIRLESAMLEEKGLQYDRRWMLVDGHGDFLSQRRLPGMALFKVQLNEEGLKIFYKNENSNGLIIPYNKVEDNIVKVRIWEDQVDALQVSDDVDDWFSKRLGFSCQLVYMLPETPRKLKPKYAVNGETVSFADGMPYLIIGQSSLDDLNGRLKESVQMDRFRPNFVFKGGEAFGEDNWDKVQIGKAIFKVTKPCARCVMTTVDQQSGKLGKEPLKTLSAYRAKDNHVMFGQNMLLLEGESVKVGDRVMPVFK